MDDDADQTDVIDDEELVIDEPQDDSDEGETPEPDESEAVEQPDEPEEGIVVSIGDEPAESSEDEFQGKPAPSWVKQLRERNRELDRENRELKQARVQPADTVVGKEPELEDFDFDADRFKAAYRDWTRKKADQDAEEARKREKQEADAKAWQATLENHTKRASALKVPDYEVAQAAVEAELAPIQIAIFKSGSEDSALVEYALGKNPKKLKELAAISDPVKFAFAVAKLETQLKVTPRKTAPIPEKTVRGSAPVSGVANAKLARLEAEADRTNDRTKVIAYRKSLGK